MQKIVVDTNIFISSLIQHGYSHLIVNETLNNPNIELCISDPLFKEYSDVLKRERFAKFKDFQANSHILLVDIEVIGRNYYPTVKHDIIKDKDDNKLLELAETCKADYLITGNRNDFTMKEFKGTKVVTPKEYWETHRPK